MFKINVIDHIIAIYYLILESEILTQPVSHTQLQFMLENLVM
jgi:hypothetical protein